ncbi:MAG: hypothetical protein M3296_09985 [Actinomycetota bacterium]|nr:hypothetical protein [Actinomycetota bacterium]
MDMTYSDAAELRERVDLLRFEYALAFVVGLDSDPAYMADLESDLAKWEAAWVGAAVTELATARAEHRGRPQG